MQPFLQSNRSNAVITCAILIFTNSFHISDSATLSSAKPFGSNISSQTIHRNTFSSMTAKSKEIDAESSALRELKEIIKLQATEIEQLKKLTKSTSKSASAHSHHGPPGDDDMDIASYLSSPFYSLALRRVGWLGVFLCSLSLTAVIMQGFEHTLSRQIELAYFVPLLAGHGGNTGGQTVGTVLSSLSNGSITNKDAIRVIRKEAMSGLTVGFLLGAVIAPMAHYGGGISLHVSTVVFCTLPLLSFIAATLASSIPFLCNLVGYDPSLIAAPAMTTFVDVTGLLAYFMIANRIFSLFGLEL